MRLYVPPNQERLFQIILVDGHVQYPRWLSTNWPSTNTRYV